MKEKQELKASIVMELMRALTQCSLSNANIMNVCYILMAIVENPVKTQCETDFLKDREIERLLRLRGEELGKIVAATKERRKIELELESYINSTKGEA